MNFSVLLKLLSILSRDSLLLNLFDCLRLTIFVVVILIILLMLLYSCLIGFCSRAIKLSLV